MDYQKKKLLTQSVAFMQANLTLTPETLDMMKSSGVLTAEEVSTIQKDETSSGKVLELVCLLKRKDNRTYSRFLQVLEHLGPCHALLTMLKSKSPLSEIMLPDPRTVHFLEQQLGGSAVNGRVIKDMAVSLVLREVYKDEINNMQEQLSILQRQLRSRSRAGAEVTRSGSDSGGSGASTPQRPESVAQDYQSAKSLPAQHGELLTIIKQKDDVIKKKDDEYTKLRKILDDTQNDLQSVLDLNSQYLTIISQMNQMQLLGAHTPRHLDKSGAAVEELEQQVEECQAEIDRLQVELGGIACELTTKEKELEKALKRESKYKRTLDLDEDADEEVVRQRIEQMKVEGSLHKHELDKIKRELDQTTRVRHDLEHTVSSLTREKDKVEFHVRQQELTIKKMKRTRTASHTIQAAEAMLATHSHGGVPLQLRLPAIDRPGSQLSLQSNKSSRNSHQYCMFCRQEYQPLKNKGCRAHFRPIRAGKWTCCNDDCHRSVGCLQIPHFYMEITVDKKVFLTDGARYMEVS